MKAYSFRIITIALLMTGLAGCAGASAANSAAVWLFKRQKRTATPREKRCGPFRSEQELKSYLKELAEKMKREPRRAVAEYGGAMLSMDTTKRRAGKAAAPALPRRIPSPMCKLRAWTKAESSKCRESSGDAASGPTVYGGHWRWRAQPVSAVDAYAPDVDPSGTWYDEMLVSGDTIAVIGYSYSRGGTEVNLFQIDSAGNLSYKSTYHLRSNDYYSSRNYASRLIGNKLIFYSPLYINPGAQDPFFHFPCGAQVAQRRTGKRVQADCFCPADLPSRAADHG